jgi:hypothetical protein
MLARLKDSCQRNVFSYRFSTTRRPKGEPQGG